MRTTINLDDALLTEAKAVAAKSGTTMTAIIEDALRIELLRRRQRDRPRVELLTSPGRSFPGINLDSTSELLDLMEDIG